MATSNRFAAYLGSTKNLVGSALGLLGVALWYFGAVGALWPLVVGGLYLAGALAAPPEKLRLVDDTPSLREAHARLAAAEPRLPADLRPGYAHLLAVLASPLAHPAELAADPDTAHDLSRLLRTDVPLAVETHANLPWWLSGTRTGELATQLTLLSADAERVATRFFTSRLNQQTDHTRYLRDRAEDP